MASLSAVHIKGTTPILRRDELRLLSALAIGQGTLPAPGVHAGARASGAQVPLKSLFIWCTVETGCRNNLTGASQKAWPFSRDRKLMDPSQTASFFLRIPWPGKGFLCGSQAPPCMSYSMSVYLRAKNCALVACRELLLLTPTYWLADK